MKRNPLVGGTSAEEQVGRGREAHRQFSGGSALILEHALTTFLSSALSLTAAHKANILISLLPVRKQRLR